MAATAAENALFLKYETSMAGWLLRFSCHDEADQDDQAADDRQKHRRGR